MILYGFARWAGGIALRWFYRDIEIAGSEQIPAALPLLLAVNHPNALIDAMVVMHIVRRPIRLTAKATLFENRFVGVLLRAVGVVPLRRMKDERERDPSTAMDSTRNREAFRAVTESLRQHNAVLVFPEGVSHDRPSLAPLRTGIARMAFQARDEGVSGLLILPLGLIFERKGQPRSRIFVRVGNPIDLDHWQPATTDPVPELTAEIERGLRAATLNFATAEEAAQTVGAARVVAGSFDEPRSLTAPDRPLGDEVDIIWRISQSRDQLPPHTLARVAHLASRIEALRAELEQHAIPVGDVRISPALGPAAWFALREGAIVAGAGPVAWWGRINHWLPFTLARVFAGRMSHTPEDPAMQTVLAGFALVLSTYMVQTVIVWRLAGVVVALAYLLSLPAAATWDLRFRDRIDRASQRMRVYFRYRADPALQPRLDAELRAIRDEVLALEVLTRNSGSAARAARTLQ